MAARKQKAEAPKPQLMYATATERHYVNGLAEYLGKDGEWHADDASVFEQ